MREFSRPRCSVDGCTRRHKGRGYCELHLRRERKHGDPLALGQSGRPLKGDAPTWSTIHKRLSRERGVARNQPCIDCGGRAREWSYDGADPIELRSEEHGFVLAYSLDLAHYVARCSSCHRLHDNALRRLTITEVAQ